MTATHRIPATSQTIDRTHKFASDSSQALVKVSETWLAATVDCQREMMAFVSMRLGKDGQSLRDMMACKNPAEMIGIQTRWVEETLRDYNAEMTKLIATCSSSMNIGGRDRE